MVRCMCVDEPADIDALIKVKSEQNAASDGPERPGTSFLSSPRAAVRAIVKRWGIWHLNKTQLADDGGLVTYAGNLASSIIH